MFRHSRLVLLACLIAGLASTPVLAQQTGGPPASPRPAGAPQGGGVQKFVERFNAANTTGDGHLTRDQAEAGHLPFVVKHFAEIDTQHNGFVTLADIRAYRQRFNADRNTANGPPTSPSPASSPHAGGAQKFGERFNAANTAGDGHLTRDQAEAGHLPFVVKHFAEIDTQNKGFVTLADIRSYRQRLRAERAPGDGPPGHP